MPIKNFGEDAKNVRKSSFELLRIIAMLMIVFHHFAAHSDFAWDSSSITLPYLWYNFIYMYGKVGVDIFVLISGYFLIKKPYSSLDIKKLLRLWLQIEFYSLAIYAAMCISGIVQFSLKTTVWVMFPITFKLWWFACTYFMLYILHPFLNIFLNHISKSTYQHMLIILIVVWSIFPTLTTKDFEGNGLTWFVLLYAIAGYIRLYGLNHNLSSKFYWLFFFGRSAVTYISSLVISFMAARWSFLNQYVTYFYGMEKVTVLFISLSLFMAFSKLDIKQSRVINLVASTTFGVYLLHDSMFMQRWLWPVLVNASRYKFSLYLIPYSLAAVIMVFAVAVIVDMVRQMLLGSFFDRIIDRCIMLLSPIINKVYDIIRKFVFG